MAAISRARGRRVSVGGARTSVPTVRRCGGQGVMGWCRSAKSSRRRIGSLFGQHLRYTRPCHPGNTGKRTLDDINRQKRTEPIVRHRTSAACPWKLCSCVQVFGSQNLTLPIESPDTMVPSLDRGVRMASKDTKGFTHPRTPTAHTNVRSPRTLSVPIRSSTRPVAKSNFRMLLSEPPVTSHDSDHSSSSSSESASTPAFCAFFVRGTGGPHAMLRIRLFTRSKRRRCVSWSYSRDRSRTEPSSHPSARIVDAALGEMDQMGPPCELRVRWAK